jgi:Tol biopolymer transport system component
MFPPALNVYLRDRHTQTTTLVSVNLPGNGGGNGDSWPAAITDDGRFALFESAASDLVLGDTNQVTDVFLRDLEARQTYLISADQSGNPANGASYSATMTPDARFLAFASAATNLVAGDTNGLTDIFVKDRQIGSITLVSVGATSNASFWLPNGSDSPQITPDGRYVVFLSSAKGIVQDAVPHCEVYLRDLVLGVTTWVSAGARPVLQPAAGTFVISMSPCLSDDAQRVAYEACLASSSALSNPGVVLRYSMSSGATEILHTNAVVPPSTPRLIQTLDSTPDGQTVVFTAKGIPFFDTHQTSTLLLWDGLAGTLETMSQDLPPPFGTNIVCRGPRVDRTGRFVAFSVTANELADTSGIFLRDRHQGTSLMLEPAGAGPSGLGIAAGTNAAGPVCLVVYEAQLEARSPLASWNIVGRASDNPTRELISPHAPDLPSRSPAGASGLGPFALSADRRYLAFASEAGDLVEGDTNRCRDVFVADLLQPTNYLVSVALGGGPGDDASFEPRLSASGRRVAFSSRATNLSPLDTNRVSDVFLRDLDLAITSLVSASADGASPGNGISSGPVLNEAGDVVLFRSRANNLGDVGTWDGTTPRSLVAAVNLFRRDLNTGRTLAITVGGLWDFAVSSDGRYLAVIGGCGEPGRLNGLYLLDCSRLAANPTRPFSELLLYSGPLPLGGFPAMTLSPNGPLVVAFQGGGPLRALDGSGTNGWVTIASLAPAPRAGLQFSRDGRFLTFSATLPNSLSSTPQVYLYDWLNQTNFLVSQSATNSGPANGPSVDPRISPDGRYIVYRSSASDLIPAATGIPPALFLFDTSIRTTSLAVPSSLPTGAPADLQMQPAFSADSQWLVFVSSGLAPGDFNNRRDLFAVRLGSSGTLPVFPIQSLTPPIGLQGPSLVWPAQTGWLYRVQFKNSLWDPVWQEQAHGIRINGGQGSFTDPSPIASQRFYRIVAY